MSSWIKDKAVTFADLLTNLDHQNWEACKAFVQQVRKFNNQHLQEHTFNDPNGVSTGQLRKLFGLFKDKTDIEQLKPILKTYITRASKKGDKKQLTLEAFLQFLVKLIDDLEHKTPESLESMRFLLLCFIKTHTLKENSSGAVFPKIPVFQTIENDKKATDKFIDEVAKIEHTQTPTQLRKILALFNSAKTPFDFAQIQLDLDYMRSKKQNNFLGFLDTEISEITVKVPKPNKIDRSNFKMNAKSLSIFNQAFEESQKEWKESNNLALQKLNDVVRYVQIYYQIKAKFKIDKKQNRHKIDIIVADLGFKSKIEKLIPYLDKNLDNLVVANEFDKLIKELNTDMQQVASSQMYQTLRAISNCKNIEELAWLRPLLYYRTDKVVENFTNTNTEESVVHFHYLDTLDDLIKKTNTQKKLENLQFIIETITTKHQTNGK